MGVMLTMGASTAAKVTVSSDSVRDWCGCFLGGDVPSNFLRLVRWVGEKKVLMELWMEGMERPRCFFEGV